MGARHWARWLFVAFICALLAAPAAAQRSGTTERGYRDEGRYRRGDVYSGRDTRRQGRPRGYQEPAFARGYSDGWEKGLDDGRDRDRYDPVRHGDYRSADDGYQRSYGSREAYKNNYRAGFRQGYEDGYRDARGRYRR